MGIKDINKILTQQSPNSFFVMPLNMLSGKRVAIDSSFWMRASMSTARKRVIERLNLLTDEINVQDIRREWFLLAINFVLDWLSYGVHPIFIFDGHSIPEKIRVKEDRHNKKLAAKKKIEDLYQQIHNPNNLNTGVILADLKKKLTNYNYLDSEEYELFRLIISGIGIPCLQAIGDAEHLCTSLCIEGKVAAVYSSDTDNLAYGCPLLITSFDKGYHHNEFGNRVIRLNCVRHDRILYDLKLNHETFVELCIMLGCDFNTNMPGIATKSYRIISQYKSIDNLPKDKYNITCLNHIRCRELFSYCDSRTLTVGDYCIDINKNFMMGVRDYLEMVGVSSQIPRIVDVYSRITPAVDGYVTELNLAPAPKYKPIAKTISYPVLNILSVPSYPTLNIISK